MKDLKSFYLKLQTSLYFFSRLNNPFKDFYPNFDNNSSPKLSNKLDNLDSIEKKDHSFEDINNNSNNIKIDSSDNIDYLYLKWRKGIKKYLIDDVNKINEDTILEQFYLYMKLNSYQLNQYNNIWYCSNKNSNNIYYIETLKDNILSFSCTCPYFSYHNENCKHIYMLQGLFIFLNNNNNEIDFASNFIKKIKN